jgi:hypothetical protein
MVLQQTTRELWASQGPFKADTVHGVPQQHIPAEYLKGAVWQTNCYDNGLIRLYFFFFYLTVSCLI